jgi:hypothetical protein
VGVLYLWIVDLGSAQSSTIIFTCTEYDKNNIWQVPMLMEVNETEDVWIPAAGVQHSDLETTPGALAFITIWL